MVDPITYIDKKLQPKRLPMDEIVASVKYNKRVSNPLVVWLPSNQKQR